MPTEENKALVLRFIAAEEQGDIALLGRLMAPDFRLYLPGSPEPMDGESTKTFFATFHAAFPDSSRTIEDQIAEEELVATRVTVRGTHSDEFQGIPPTGKQVTITGIGIHRVVDGRIAEHWPQPDLLGLMQQIGAIPQPEQTPDHRSGARDPGGYVLSAPVSGGGFALAIKEAGQRYER